MRTRKITIGITGPESSGKSALAKFLARKFHAFLVPEFARSYLEQTDGVYSYSDLLEIAMGQKKHFEDGLKSRKSVIVSDTDLTVIKIWSEHKYRKVDEHLMTLYERERMDLYLLCKPDLIWKDDPLRESPNNRDELFDLYLKDLTDRKLNYLIISGKSSERKRLASEAVRKLVSEKMDDDNLLSL